VLIRTLVQWKNDAKKICVHSCESLALLYAGHFRDCLLEESRAWRCSAAWMDRWHGQVRDGIALPREVPQEILHKLKARTCVSGYLLATVPFRCSIMFEFKRGNGEGPPDSVRALYGNKFVKSCSLRIETTGHIATC